MLAKMWSNFKFIHSSGESTNQKTIFALPNGNDAHILRTSNSTSRFIPWSNECIKVPEDMCRNVYSNTIPKSPQNGQSRTDK